MTDLALKIDRSVSRVSRWLGAGEVPSGSVIAVETHTGVPRSIIRPDLYPPENGSEGV